MDSIQEQTNAPFGEAAVERAGENAVSPEGKQTPLPSGKTTPLLSIVLIGLLFASLAVVGYRCANIGLLSDSGRIVGAWKWAKSPNLLPDPFWPPMPFYVHGVGLWLFGHPTLTPVIINNILTGLTVIFVFMLADRLFNRETAWLAGLLAATNPLLQWVGSSGLSEPLYLAGIMGTLVGLVGFWQQQKARWACLTAVSLLAAVGSRAESWGFLPVILLAILCFHLVKGHWRKIGWSAVCVLPALVFVGLWGWHLYDPATGKFLYTSSLRTDYLAVRLRAMPPWLGGIQILGHLFLVSPIIALMLVFAWPSSLVAAFRSKISADRWGLGWLCIVLLGGLAAMSAMYAVTGLDTLNRPQRIGLVFMLLACPLVGGWLARRKRGWITVLLVLAVIGWHGWFRFHNSYGRGRDVTTDLGTVIHRQVLAGVVKPSDGLFCESYSYSHTGINLYAQMYNHTHFVRSELGADLPKLVKAMQPCRLVAARSRKFCEVLAESGAELLVVAGEYRLFDRRGDSRRVLAWQNLMPPRPFVNIMPETLTSGLTLTGAGATRFDEFPGLRLGWRIGPGAKGDWQIVAEFQSESRPEKRFTKIFSLPGGLLTGDKLKGPGETVSVIRTRRIDVPPDYPTDFYRVKLKILRSGAEASKPGRREIIVPLRRIPLWKKNRAVTLQSFLDGRDVSRRMALTVALSLF